MLLERLGAGAGRSLTADGEMLLLGYCTEIVLNIVWYERARKREQRRNRLLTALTVVVMITALGLLVASALPSLVKQNATPTTAFTLAVFSGGILTVMQVLAALTDGKAKLSIFWKASSDLKEALYTFEQKWRQRAFVPEGNRLVLTPEATVAVEDARRTARAVARSERLEYFSAMKTPADVLAVAVAAADSLRARRAETVAAVSGREQRIADARKAVAEARASVLASEYRLEALSDPAEKTAEAKILMKARAELVRAQSVAQEVANG